MGVLAAVLTDSVGGVGAQIVSSQMPDVLEKLLTATADDGRNDLIRKDELLTAITTLLLALLEGVDSAVEERLLRVLDLHTVASIASQCYRRGMESREADGSPTEESEQMLRPAFALSILLFHLTTYQVEECGGSTEEATSMLTNAFGAEPLSALREEVARVEILNAEGELERVHFRVPDFCRLLPPSTRRRIVWEVDRDTPGKQLRDLISWSHTALAEMWHQRALQRHCVWRVVMRHRQLFENLIFAMAVVQNGILILRYSFRTNMDASTAADVVDEADGDVGSSNAAHADALALLYTRSFYLFGALQLLACIVTGVVYGVANSPVRVRRMWKEATGLSLHKTRESGEMRLRLAARVPFYLLSDRQLLMYAGFAAAAVVGLVGSPFWFSVHLLDLANKSPDLQNVFRAVTLNGKSIVMTALFGLILIYLYAIVGFLFSQDDMVLDNYPDADIPMCTNLLVCWAAAINEGLRGSDIGAIMEPVGADEPLRFVFNFVFQFTFWISVITILLNVIFGIIIDTFGELRADYAFKKNHMETTCFICGIDRFTFDTKGKGFEAHIRDDHNMWNYLFLVIYLHEKEPTTYNGWEQYVARKLKADDTSFIPRNTALVLKEEHEREKAENRALLDRTGAILEGVNHLVGVVDAVRAEQLMQADLTV